MVSSNGSCSHFVPIYSLDEIARSADPHKLTIGKQGPWPGRSPLSPDPSLEDYEPSMMTVVTINARVNTWTAEISKLSPTTPSNVTSPSKETSTGARGLLWGPN